MEKSQEIMRRDMVFVRTKQRNTAGLEEDTSQKSGDSLDPFLQDYDGENHDVHPAEAPPTHPVAAGSSGAE